jgi:hypothetical protein
MMKGKILMLGFMLICSALVFGSPPDFEKPIEKVEISLVSEVLTFNVAVEAPVFEFTRSNSAEVVFCEIRTDIALTEELAFKHTLERRALINRQLFEPERNKNFTLKTKSTAMKRYVDLFSLTSAAFSSDVYFGCSSGGLPSCQARPS